MDYGLSCFQIPPKYPPYGVKRKALIVSATYSAEIANGMVMCNASQVRFLPSLVAESEMNIPVN